MPTEQPPALPDDPISWVAYVMDVDPNDVKGLDGHYYVTARHNAAHGRYLILAALHRYAPQMRVSLASGEGTTYETHCNVTISTVMEHRHSRRYPSPMLVRDVMRALLPLE